MSVSKIKDKSSTRNWKRVGNKGLIKIGFPIGKGNQSRIFRGIFNDRDVAVKNIFYDGSIKEVEILRNLNHENIIRIFFMDVGQTNLYIVLEYCKHTLKEYVESSYKSNNLTPIKVLEQVTEGLYYLHNGQKFCTVHRDLKPSNILFQYVEREKIWKVKISDFGISKEFYGDKTSTMTRVRGTSGYTAPELLTSDQDMGRIRKETDMFSLGVIYYYTLSGGKHPFSDDPNDVNAKVRDCEPCLDKLLPEYVGSVESLILAMLRKDYQERISVSEVKCHHIFWAAEKKRDFLKETSNYMEDRGKHQKLIKQFETCLGNITGGNLWKDLICNDKPELKKVIEKRSGWEKKTSLQDLLRLIRNWSSHFYDKNTTSELQTELGGASEYPKGFIDFFESRFPKLIPTCYDIMKTYKNEDIFKMFYVIEKEPTCRVEEPASLLLSSAPDIDSTNEDESDEDDIMPSSDEDEVDAVEVGKSSILVLRNYQKELAEQALDGQNSLIIAPTGSGKTAVANEIIKNHLLSGKSKSIIFLVSKTTLARQQYDFFTRHLGERLKEKEIAHLIGENKTSYPVGAIIKYMKLIVLTPQILIDELRRSKSFISFANISMLIFDECHNATKKHSYKVLMDLMLDYKADHADEDPIQVVGMTASPGVGRGKTREQVLENLLTLLANLDIKNCPAVVERHIDELKKFQNEILECYIRVTIEEDRFFRKINEAMGLIEKKLTDLSVLGNNVGHFSALPPNAKDAQMYENWVVELIHHIKVNEEGDVSKVAITYAQHLKMYHTLLYFKKHIPNAMEYTNTLAEFDQDGKVGKFLRTINSKLSRAAVNTKVPMLEKLFTILQDEFEKNVDSRCIIFVPRKLIAPALVDCIRDNDDLKHLGPEFVTGKAEHTMGGMTKTKQESSIRAFREGKCKVLIATSVAEEGLDIHACNLVIMYNYVTGEVGRIQRAGRGRAENSRSILITPQGSIQIQKEKSNMICAYATEQALLDLKELSFDERLGQIEKIQKIQKRERQRCVNKPTSKFDEPSKWCILCGQCKVEITKANKLRRIKNQHVFVVDSEFANCVKKHECTPVAVVPGLSFKQTGILKCIDTACMCPLGLEMQYKEVKYPTLKVKHLLFDHRGNVKYFKKWNECPFEIEDIDVELDEDELKEIVLSQRNLIPKGFTTDNMSPDDASELLSITNSS